MVALNPTIFFEYELERRWLTLSRAFTGNGFVLRDWVQSKSSIKPLPETNRQAILSEWLPESERHKATLYLNTLEELRESFILIPDHADHCFSLLPTSPKNRLLKNLLKRYFDSPLSYDWVAAAWEVIGLLKARKLGELGRVILVPGFSQSLITREVTSALRYCAEDIETFEPSTIAEKPVFYFGSFAERSQMLAELVENSLKHSNRQVLIPFEGPDSTRSVLRNSLATRGIDSSIVAHPTNVVPSRLEKFRNSPFPLSEQLLLLDLALSPSAPTHEYWEALFSQHKIGEEHYAFAVGVNNRTPIPTAMPAVAPVHIGPMVIPPQHKDELVFAFLSDHVWQRNTPSLLKEEEKFLLIREGFPMPRQSDFRASLFRQLDRSSVVLGSSHFEIPPHFQRLPCEVIPKLRSLSTESEISLPKKPWSASALETFANCPTRYLLSHRLHLRRHSKRNDEFLALALGSITHKVLEAYYRNGCRNTSDLLALFDKEVSQEPNDSFRTLLRMRFQRIAERLPTIDKTLSELFENGRPILFEEKFESTIDGITIRGTIDRIDANPEGLHLLLDYKTGFVDFSPNHILKGSHFQALVYLLCAPIQPCMGFLFIDLKNGEVRRGLVREENAQESKKLLTRGHVLNTEKWDALFRTGIEHIKKADAELRAGRFKPTPCPDTCETCDYLTHCRKSYGTHA